MSWRRRSRRRDYWGYPPKTTVAEQERRAARQAAALEKEGHKLSPVVLDGHTIARTFWGKAWCANLEGYSDYANRLPRGRSYVRSGAVIDLQIEPGKVIALVQGRSLYTVTITIQPVEHARYRGIVAECGGQIGSVVELLQGKLSKAVMEVISRKDTGLFPAPSQIALQCSCPDWATMCKHVAAVLYGVGARLDEQPELLFRLRGTDPTELIAAAAEGAVLGGRAVAKEKQLTGDIAGVFGIDLDMGHQEATSPRTADRAAPAARVKAVKAGRSAPAAPLKPAKAAKPNTGVSDPIKSAKAPRARTKKPVVVEHPDWCTCTTCVPPAS